MTIVAAPLHAPFDRYPQLLDSLAEEFGRDGIVAVAERVIAAEFADVHWDGRFAERDLGACDSLDEEGEGFRCVAIAGYFRGRYYAAICAVDVARRVDRLLTLRHADSGETAVAFLHAPPS